MNKANAYQRVQFYISCMAKSIIINSNQNVKKKTKGIAEKRKKERKTSGNDVL